MPITSDDIKLLESERMRDTDDGGGRATANVIPLDGENSIFPDISEDDYTQGRVNLRKLFAKIFTDDDDPLFGATLALFDAPTNTNVQHHLFRTTDPAGDRADAVDRLENYLARGPRWHGYLYGQHVEGQKAILVFMRPEQSVPTVGETMFMVKDGGLVTEETGAYRVADVTDELRTFTDAQGDYQRKIVTIEITEPLEFDVLGVEPERIDAEIDDPEGELYISIVADATDVFGIRPLAEAGTEDDLSVKVDSIFGQLVPASQAEVPLIDQVPGGLKSVTITSGGEDFDIAGPSHTGAITVEQGNVGLNYVFNAQPIPAPGALTIEYISQGRWYTIEDDGNGVLSGAGAGTVSYSTGSISVTLQALPDVPSEIVFTWAAKVHYIDRAGSSEVGPVAFRHTLANAVNLTDSVFTMSWTGSDTTAKTATANSSGVISGDATGTIVASAGEVYVEFAAGDIPAPNSSITFDYSQETRRAQTISPTLDATTATFTLANTPVETNSIFMKIPYLQDGQKNATNLQSFEGFEPYIYSVIDDGAGNVQGVSWIEGESINYATGDIVLPRYVVKETRWWNCKTRAWEYTQRTAEIAGSIYITYKESSATPSVTQEVVAAPPLTVTFLAGLQDLIIPGTVRFRIGNQAYSDRAGQGLLYLVDGTIAGNIDYQARTATLTTHSIAAQAQPDVVIDSMVSTYGDFGLFQLYFRVAGAPVQPASLILQGTAHDGTLVTGTADLSGDIDDDDILGEITEQIGSVNVRFGELVLESTLTNDQRAEWWYDADDIDGNGDIFVPKTVIPSSVRYSAVFLVPTSQDAELLGINPVRLPVDGRVPIYRPGYTTFLHHTDTVADTWVDSDVVALGRTNVARVRIIDNAGDVVGSAAYAFDAAAGTVTWDSVSGVSMPATIYHTILDSLQVTGTSIDGTIDFARAISRDYPLGSYLSSAVRFGDLQAQALNLFDQASWDEETWIRDDEISAATASYDSATYPLAVTNRGVISEYWIIRFTNATNFEVFGKSVGLIATGNVTTDLAPLNPTTSVPYFTLQSEGWGNGWEAGNVLGFETRGEGDVWITRSVQPSEPEDVEHKMLISVRGGIDA